MNENLIDLNFDETQLQKASSESQPQLFACEGVVSERKSLSCVNSSFFKVTSETQTSDENLLEIVHDDFMQNRVVAIEPTPYTVTQG